MPALMTSTTAPQVRASSPQTTPALRCATAALLLARSTMTRSAQPTPRVGGAIEASSRSRLNHALQGDIADAPLQSVGLHLASGSGPGSGDAFALAVLDCAER
eukprot:6201869-Pyramimonas_sp.AAC.1